MELTGEVIIGPGDECCDSAEIRRDEMDLLVEVLAPYKGHKVSLKIEVEDLGLVEHKPIPTGKSYPSLVNNEMIVKFLRQSMGPMPKDRFAHDRTFANLK